MTEIIRHFGFYSMVRADYVAITGDACAAQLLSSLEYWTRSKIVTIEEIERRNADARSESVKFPVPDLWLYEKTQDFVDSLYGTFKRNKVLSSLKLLKELGFVETKPSPHPWDQTLLWKLNIEKIQEALDIAAQSFFKQNKSKTTKSPCVRIQTVEGLENSDPSVLEQTLDHPNLNNVGLDLATDLIYDSRSNIQSKNSKDPPTPQGGAGFLSQEGGILEEEDRNHKLSEPPQEEKQGLPEQTKSSSGDQTSPAPTPVFSVHKKEDQARIVATYQTHKPAAWLPVNNLHRDIRVQVDSLLSSETFQGDLEAFLTRLENALREINDPTTKFGWFRNQGNLGLRTLLSNYGRHLMEISDAWTERQKPQVQSDTLPDWALEAQKEIEARQLKKAG